MSQRIKSFHTSDLVSIDHLEFFIVETFAHVEVSGFDEKMLLWVGLQPFETLEEAQRFQKAIEERFRLRDLQQPTRIVKSKRVDSRGIEA